MGAVSETAAKLSDDRAGTHVFQLFIVRIINVLFVLAKKEYMVDIYKMTRK
jgi:hypothetical protein